MSDLNRRDFAAMMAGAAVFPSAARRPALQARAPAINPPSASALAELSRWMEMGGTPGLSTGVVQNGKLVWERYEGVTDAATKTPVTRDSLFPAASLGKPVAALGALWLVDQGKLDLDRPLKSYVSDHTPADPRGDLVTARHVLSHSTGYRNWRNSPDQALLPEFDPGSRFQYSGEGFYYLQRVLEKVNGSSFEQFMEDALFGPLAMKSSTYGWRADTDAAFLNALLTPANAAVTLKPETRRQMGSAQTRINSALGWGLGWGLDTNSGRDYIWHWGDNGNWKNFVFAHPASRTAIVVFTNGNNGMRVCERLVSAAAGVDPLAFAWV